MISKQKFNDAVKNYSDSLFGYMLKLTKDKDEAQNWVQEAYTVLWEKRNDVDPEKAKSFLFTTAYRKMIDAYRKKKVRENYAPFVNVEVFNQPKELELKQLLSIAFERIDEKKKAIILLRDYEGYDYQSIADIMQISLSNVKVNLFRARKEMKQILSALLKEKEVKNAQ